MISTINNVPAFGLLLCCFFTEVPFSHIVEFSLQLVSRASEEHNIEYRRTHYFSVDAKKKHEGVGRIIATLPELKDLKKGFILNEKITVRVKAKVVQ